MVAVLVAPVVATVCRSTLEQTTAWYNGISHGRCQLDFQCTPPVIPPRPLGYYAGAGGKGPWPANSQGLALDILRGLPQDMPHAKLLIVATEKYLPHTWHIRGGRRYAVVPSTANLGVLAHEIGHLAFDWPDLHWPLDGETECLMARGAAGPLGSSPAPPCAPLLVRAGWRNPIPITREMKVSDVKTERVVAIDWNKQPLLVEARPSRLLLLTADPAPRLLARVALTPADQGRSLLGLLAPRLRRLPTGTGTPPVAF